MSTASPARVEANRKNAALSTGPRTAEGKESSRRNSLKHGLTGSGIVVPDEDLARIAEVADALYAEHRPTTPVGLAMIDRAAMLLVRLDRAGQHELALVASQVQAAVYDFNQARRDWADELFEGLEANPGAIRELNTFPEGIDRLIEAWSSLAYRDEWSSDDIALAATLSDAGTEDPATLRRLIPDAIARLEAARDAIDRRPIDRARQQAADLALFSDSPEATLARKYEAATERALHKALKTLHEAESQAPTAEAPQTTNPAAPLGSFSPKPPATPTVRPAPEPTGDPVVPNPPVDRARRPDPRKLREAMRRNKR